ncbi:hypothetical protein [Salinimonas chungwhensis]|uniref:hypothetical protein n=1 Tax=Salinimonas chungwhensis TaxID=265425 RepID=UPI00036EFC47|nr:hypothetical protein [Salinimonas chungwhensis]
MFRKLVIFIEIAALILILRMNAVQNLLSDVQETVTQWFTTIEKIPDNLALRDLRKQSDDMYNTMRPFQQTYLNEILSSRSNVQHFYQTYCLSDDKNPFIEGQNRTRFCHQLTDSDLLKNQTARVNKP